MDLITLLPAGLLLRILVFLDLWAYLVFVSTLGKHEIPSFHELWDQKYWVQSYLHLCQGISWDQLVEKQAPPYQTLATDLSNIYDHLVVSISHILLGDGTVWVYWLLECACDYLYCILVLPFPDYLKLTTARRRENQGWWSMEETPQLLWNCH